MSEPDVVIVGAGVMGSATARSLAARGREVLVLERFEVGHRRGSSHGTSRIFRLSYHDATFVRMAMEALPLWRELEAESGSRLITVTGGLDLGPERIRLHGEALRRAGAASEVIRGEDVLRRFPFFTVPKDEPALYQPDAGFIAADLALRAFVASAVSHGAELREATRVLEVRADGDDRAEVVTDDRTYRPRRVVVTAGAWARDLLAAAGIDLPTTPTRETVAYFPLPDGLVPPPLVDWTEPPYPYALPSPGQGLKVGRHRAGPVADPDDEEGPLEESLASMASWLKRRFATATPTPLAGETCLYTNTPDEHFILERRGPIVIGSPCSGHGFKFAPLIGERLAKLAG